MRLKTAEEFLVIALGGNMNIATLKLKAWHEIMTDYAKHYHLQLTNYDAGGFGLEFVKCQHSKCGHNDCRQCTIECAKEF